MLYIDEDPETERDYEEGKSNIALQGLCPIVKQTRSDEQSDEQTALLDQQATCQLCCVKCRWTALLSVLFVLLLLLTLASISLTIAGPLTFLKQQDTFIQTQKLNNGGFKQYGIHCTTFDGQKYKAIVLKSDAKLLERVTMVLTDSNTVQVSPNKDLINTSLADGPSINTVYSYKNFTYVANITGEIGSEFRVKFTRKDLNENVDFAFENFTIMNSTGVFIHYTSMESGYYDVTYTLHQETSGSVTGYLFYNSIDIVQYKNETRSCSINSGEQSCEYVSNLLHDFKKFDVLVFLESDHSPDFTFTSTWRHWMIETSYAIVASVFLILCLIGYVMACVHYVCIHSKRVKTSTEVMETPSTQEKQEAVIVKNDAVLQLYKNSR